jgi:hypothetical protein
LKRLTFGECYDKTLYHIEWPQSLLFIHDYSCKIHNDMYKFPESLYQIIYYNVSYDGYLPDIVYNKYIN